MNTPKIEVDFATMDRLRLIERELREILDRGPLRPHNLISLILDHWRVNPPKVEWLKGQANLYPADMGPRRRK